ncbi:MAG: restriction endonuclease [Anaerolineae bacterium]|nr:restriction endonuclease [Anaerolineae bacterium]
MAVQDRAILFLEEYQPTSYPREQISDELGEMLWRTYGSQVAVEFPSPKTGGQWQLTSQGWVGHIPLTPELGLALTPKVPLDNLFGMLEYAYRLRAFRFLEGLSDCKSLEEFYERLANVLARRVLARGRKGFYRTYVPEAERLPYVRGRLDIWQTIRRPWDVRPQCRYEEHTADIEENQILAWALLRIAHSGACTERVLPTVRRAYRALHGFVSVQSFGPRDCVGRLYNRLNEDYHPLHALCRFFLEHSGPSHEMGDRKILPFLANMARLYELFVAEWLKAHLPQDLLLRIQEKVDIGEGDELSFQIDLVLYDAETGKAHCVLDTKYKAPEHPDPDDVAKVVAYAEMKGCDDALLVYPTPLSHPLDESIGNIRVRSMTFSLDGDLEAAGWSFLDNLLRAKGVGGNGETRMSSESASWMVLT